MNKFIEQFDKEFDEIYGNLTGIKPFSLDLKSFFHSKIDELLKEIMKKCVPEKKIVDGLSSDYGLGYGDGFNSAREQTLKNLRELK